MRDLSELSEAHAAHGRAIDEAPKRYAREIEQARRDYLARVRVAAEALSAEINAHVTAFLGSGVGGVPAPVGGGLPHVGDELESEIARAAAGLASINRNLGG